MSSSKRTQAVQLAGQRLRAWSLGPGPFQHVLGRLVDYSRLMRMPRAGNLCLLSHLGRWQKTAALP